MNVLELSIRVFKSGLGRVKLGLGLNQDQVMSGQSSFRSGSGSGRVNFSSSYNGSFTFSDIGRVQFELKSDRVQFQVRVVLSRVWMG